MTIDIFMINGKKITHRIKKTNSQKSRKYISRRNKNMNLQNYGNIYAMVGKKVQPSKY